MKKVKNKAEALKETDEEIYRIRLMKDLSRRNDVSDLIDLEMDECDFDDMKQISVELKRMIDDENSERIGSASR